FLLTWWDHNEFWPYFTVMKKASYTWSPFSFFPKEIREDDKEEITALQKKDLKFLFLEISQWILSCW
ncbi:hypothetical protein, partial [Pseudomonas syringae group genomosp. 7]|uniref:hypothetical protein n=1 Tax=Pseudomonas syringae group genomosp. 7 TaxID=251699 RepID=UPI00376F886F